MVMEGKESGEGGPEKEWYDFELCCHSDLYSVLMWSLKKAISTFIKLWCLSWSIILKIRMWNMMDCKHEHWWLEHCVKCSSTEEMKYCLFIPWKSLNIFTAKRRGILSQYLIWDSCLSLMKWEHLNLPCLHSHIHTPSHWNCPALLTQSSPTKYHLPETDQEKQQARFGLSLWRSPAVELLCEEGKWLHRSNSTEVTLGFNLLWSVFF